MNTEASSKQETAGSCCVEGTCRHDRGPVVDWTGTQRLQFGLAGFSRPGDAATLAAWLESLQGVSEAVVNPITERAVVRVDPSVCEVSEIVGLLAGRGLEADHTLARWHLPAPGLTCARCISRVQKAIRQVPGVEGATVNREAAELTIEYVPSRVDFGQLLEVLRPGEAVGSTPGELEDWSSGFGMENDATPA